MLYRPENVLSQNCDQASSVIPYTMLRYGIPKLVYKCYELTNIVIYVSCYYKQVFLIYSSS